MPENQIKRTVVWMDAGVMSRMDGWLAADNCKNRSEFVNKALRFYMGYLAAEDTSVFLSRTLVDTLQGIVADSHNRRELRAYAVDEVRRTNGQISFDAALDQQRRFPDEPDDLFDV